MREWFDQRGMDGKQGIEEVRQPDAVCFGDEAEHPPVAVEAPGTPRCCDFQGCFAVPVDQFITEPPGGVLVGKLDGGFPIHFTSTTVTRASGRMPLTDVPRVRSSSCAIGFLWLAPLAAVKEECEAIYH